MWVQAGFSPTDFYDLTLRHFQMAMEGVRKRLKQESELGFWLAHQTGLFSGLGVQGTLKQFSHYAREDNSAQSPRDMLSMLKSMGANSNMTIKRVKRAND